MIEHRFEVLGDTEAESSAIVDESEPLLSEIPSRTTPEPTALFGINLLELVKIDWRGRIIITSRESETDTVFGWTGHTYEISFGDSPEKTEILFDFRLFEGISISQNLVSAIFKFLGVEEPVALVHGFTKDDWRQRLLNRAKERAIPIGEKVILGPQAPELDLDFMLANFRTLIAL